MILQCNGFILRNWREGDEESLVAQANNSAIEKFLRDGFPSPYTQEDATAWIQRTKDSTTEFAIEVNGNAVGCIGIVLQENIFRRSAELGYWLGEQYWNKGIATEAIRAITEYAFAHFDLCRVYAHVFAHNTASAKALEKNGFQLEARLQKAVTKHGKTFDELMYAKIQ